jgi:hypothetical protein
VHEGVNLTPPVRALSDRMNVAHAVGDAAVTVALEHYFALSAPAPWNETGYSMGFKLPSDHEVVVRLGPDSVARITESPDCAARIIRNKLAKALRRLGV